MCLPDYVYGLILIESLGDEAALGMIHRTDSSRGQKPRTIYRPPVKLFRRLTPRPMTSLPPAHEILMPQTRNRQARFGELK